MVNIERLRAHPDNKTKQAMQRDCELAADEIESLRNDAERYRWLRELPNADSLNVRFMGADLDRVIDAALLTDASVGAA